MVRARQLPTPTVNHSLSQADMEAAVRRNKLIESAWLRASPKMESLRFVPLPASEHSWIGNIRRGFMVPGGKYFVIFVYDRACILSLEDLSRPPVPFITLQDVNLDGLDPMTCSWTTGRPDDGGITFYIAIRPIDRCVVSGALLPYCPHDRPSFIESFVPGRMHSGQPTSKSPHPLRHTVDNSRSRDHHTTYEPETTFSCSIQRMPIVSFFSIGGLCYGVDLSAITLFAPRRSL